MQRKERKKHCDNMKKYCIEIPLWHYEQQEEIENG